MDYGILASVKSKPAVDTIMCVNEKNFIVTGATSGIGSEICRMITEGGGRTFMLGRNREKLEAACRDFGDAVSCWRAEDFSEDVNYENIARTFCERFGECHGVVHIAGIERTKPFRNLKTRDFVDVMQVNFFSAVNLIRAVISERCFSREGASVVFIGSVMSLLGQPSKTAYCASKGAMIPFAKSLALELARRRIRVNTVLPGLVRTEMSIKLFEDLPAEAVKQVEKMHPLGFGRPEDVANAVGFLLSERSRWVTGTELVVDGGYSCH